jgi:AcrR family transcriptional regulator
MQIQDDSTMPKAVNVAEKRAAFVDALWRVIRKEGLPAATLRRVAQEARCTTGALTHYFPNRDALLVEALSGAHSAARARLVGVGDGRGASWSRLEALILEALPLDAIRAGEWRTRLAFWGEAIGSVALRQQNARRFAEWSTFLDSELTALIVDEKRRAHEIALLMALVDGFAVRLVLHGEARKKDLTRETEGALHAHFTSLKDRYGRHE